MMQNKKYTRAIFVACIALINTSIIFVPTFILGWFDLNAFTPRIAVYSIVALTSVIAVGVFFHFFPSGGSHMPAPTMGNLFKSKERWPLPRMLFWGWPISIGIPILVAYVVSMLTKLEVTVGGPVFLDVLSISIIMTSACERLTLVGPNKSAEFTERN